MPKKASKRENIGEPTPENIGELLKDLDKSCNTTFVYKKDIEKRKGELLNRFSLVKVDGEGRNISTEFIFKNKTPHQTVEAIKSIKSGCKIQKGKFEALCEKILDGKVIKYGLNENSRCSLMSEKDRPKEKKRERFSDKMVYTSIHDYTNYDKSGSRIFKVDVILNENFNPEKYFAHITYGSGMFSTIIEPIEVDEQTVKEWIAYNALKTIDDMEVTDDGKLYDRGKLKSRISRLDLYDPVYVLSYYSSHYPTIEEGSVAASPSEMKDDRKKVMEMVDDPTKFEPKTLRDIMWKDYGIFSYRERIPEGEMKKIASRLEIDKSEELIKDEKIKKLKKFIKNPPEEIKDNAIENAKDTLAEIFEENKPKEKDNNV